MSVSSILYYYFCGLVTKSCPTLCDPLDYSPPGSSVHGIVQARVLEWVAISSSRGSSRIGDLTCVSCLAGVFFTTEPPGKPPVLLLLRCQSGVREFEKPGSQVVLFTSEFPVWTPGAGWVWPPGSCMHFMSGIGEPTISAVIQLLHETGGIFQEIRDLATSNCSSALCIMPCIVHFHQ